MGTKEQDERDKKFEDILDGIHAFFTGAAMLTMTHNFKDPTVQIMLVKKP